MAFVIVQFFIFSHIFARLVALIRLKARLRRHFRASFMLIPLNSNRNTLQLSVDHEAAMR